MLAAIRTTRFFRDPYHDNCHDNFVAALWALGLDPPAVPAPFNLFMNVPWEPDGSLRYEPPRSRPGDLVRLRATTRICCR